MKNRDGADIEQNRSVNMYTKQELMMKSCTCKTVSKVYADMNCQASITCPHCGFTKCLDVSSFKATKKRLKATCKCGREFSFELDFRMTFRKEVQLPGTYVNLRNRSKGKVVVENISLGGLGFRCEGPFLIDKDDPLEVAFRLDDVRASRIVKRVQAKLIRDRYIGAEFYERDAHSASLGFYLRN